MFRLEGVEFQTIISIDALDIPSKQVISIVGESGSGKTTLLKMLNKLLSPTKGEIYFNEQPLSELNSVTLRRQVVMLPQTPLISPGTIRDNLLLGLKFSEKPMKEDSELSSVLSLVHLNKELDESAEQLSGGEKQRLALARVILLEPEVLLLDEPSSALDEDTEQLIIQRVVEYTREKGKSLIMVTHSKAVANTFSDVIIEICQGRVIGYREGK